MKNSQLERQQGLINSWRELADSADLYAKESEKANYPAEKIVKHATTAYDLNKCASELEGTLVAIESVSKLQSSSKAFEREVQGSASPTLREAVIQECCKILLDNGEHRAEWILLRALAAQASSGPPVIPQRPNPSPGLMMLATELGDVPIGKLGPSDPLDKPSDVKVYGDRVKELAVQARKLRIDHFTFPPSLVHREDENNEVLDYDSNCVACVIPELLRVIEAEGSAGPDINNVWVAGIERGRAIGRLEEFLNVLDNQPLDPTYWNKHEEERLREEMKKLPPPGKQLQRATPDTAPMGGQRAATGSESKGE